MGWFDWIKEIPLSAVQKEKIALIEFKLSETEKRNTFLESENTTLRKENESLQSRLNEAQKQIRELQSETYKTQKLEHDKITLDEIKTEILKALAHQDNCEFKQLENRFNFQFFNQGKPQLDRTTIQYHLDELSEEKYIGIQRSHKPDRLYLTQKGRKYLVENKLLSPAEED